eukprot:9493935-Pyramimonas_sp.AAC.2
MFSTKCTNLSLCLFLWHLEILKRPASTSCEPLPFPSQRQEQDASSPLRYARAAVRLKHRTGAACATVVPHAVLSRSTPPGDAGITRPWDIASAL